MQYLNKFFKKFSLIGMALLIAGTLSFTPVTGHGKSLKQELAYSDKLDLKYHLEITEGVMKTLNQEKEGNLTYDEFLTTIDSMTKVEVMDSYLTFYGKKIEAEEIRRVIDQVFAIDLDALSLMGEGKVTKAYPEQIMVGVRKSLNVLSTDQDSYIMALSKVEIMDLYLQSQGKKIDGQEIRHMINQIFGINLDGISGLEKARISLFSKGQWITQTDRDLIVVHTGKGDVDVMVYPTDYFKEKTGLTDLPSVLQEKLKNLGFSYNEEVGALYFTNPTGETVPDSFKGQTMGAIIGVINALYSDL